MRIEHHPYLNVWVREDGCVYVPQSGKNKAHWTYGSRGGNGYLHVRIDGRLYYTHRIVAQAYFGEIPEGCEIDHINRDRLNNAVENLRIVTPSENHRNTRANDRVNARGGTHWYEDEKQYAREQHARYYAENREKECERSAHRYQGKRKTHRVVHFADGSKRWVRNSEAVLLLAIPLNERIFKE